ncbi:phosphoglycolate phosphatase [Novimethylophilus kurashikiensis]|uniref:Phosphoglycolate phosphatase n=1 Tax=Novimethylophilus kurashikiensis TaxID=1825523 RepID=A0A2R5F6Q4_9PROT|nr:phosphoglycolate phosphatase [Novimethylophilus kurashikiensis]GBG13930.1 phosphoglycolate phosphatase [Novimethylophilus kurashikiensis]
MVNSVQFPLRIEAVVIDLDGTLLHTAPDLAEAANRMLADLGMPPVPEETLKSYIGNGVAQLIKRTLTGEMYGEPDSELFARAKPIYEKNYDEVVSLYSRPFPGVVEGLQALKAAGYHLACITNKAARFTLPLLKDTGLHDYFELILSGDTLPKMKPDPLPLLHAAEFFGVAIDRMLLIGDSQNDAQAARAAGCHVFCVPYGYNHGQDVNNLDLDAVVDNLVAASKLICKA